MVITIWHLFSVCIILLSIFLFILYRLRFEKNSLISILEKKDIELEFLNDQLIVKDKSIEQLQKDYMDLKVKHTEISTRYEQEKSSMQDKLDILKEAKETLSTTFKSISMDSLEQSHKSFLRLAESSFAKYNQAAQNDLTLKEKAIDHLVSPLKQSLESMNKQLNEIELNRTSSYSSLTEQIKTLTSTHNSLQKETGNLVKALKIPNVRGRWGEIQLRKVVELAGMLEHCDFVEQESRETDSGRLRPDMIITLPNDKNIVVDAKSPLSAYLDAVNCEDDEEKTSLLKHHSKQIRNHIISLSSKNYWQQFSPTPEFVVMFLPGENFYMAALEHDTSLLEFGINRQVILASPTTIIALLRAVAYGWRQEKMAKNAQSVCNLGKELYDRLLACTTHFEDLKKGLERSSDAYNKLVGSVENRILVSARKFKEMGAAEGSELTSLEPIEKKLRSVKQLTSPHHT